MIKLADTLHSTNRTRLMLQMLL